MGHAATHPLGASRHHPRAHDDGPDDVLDRVLTDLDRLARSPLGAWRRTMLQRLAELRELLVRESVAPADWLQGRYRAEWRDRNALLDRITVQRHQVLGIEDIDRVSHDVSRLVSDVRHHLRRLHPLAHDSR